MKSHKPLHRRTTGKKHMARTASHVNKKLYFTSGWKELRAKHLESFPFCYECGSVSKLHVDHITAHKGNMRLFLDPENLRTLCERHHSSKTAREDQIRDESGRFM